MGVYEKIVKYCIIINEKAINIWSDKMEILNETLINSKSFELLSIILKDHYEKSNGSKTVISYGEFRETIIGFIKEAMRILLENSDYYNDKYDCKIIKMSLGERGNFDLDNNLITINEDVIEKLYLGNLEEMAIIFHELGHFKVKYELISGKINVDLIRIAKELAIRSALECHLDEKEELKNPKIDDKYYCDNYVVFSEEKIVEMNAIKLLIKFLELSDIHISPEEMKKLQNEFDINEKQYQNYLRDFTHNMRFNDNWLDFEQAFDFLIKQNPSWLMIPQFSIEYCQDEDGNVKKRTKEELKIMLESETDSDMKQCIEDLLNMDSKKQLSKDDFIANYKIDKKFYIIADNYLGSRKNK